MQISLLSESPVGATNAEYASWNIDSSCNRGFHHTNFSNPNLAAAGECKRFRCSQAVHLLCELHI